jgi:site-specific DNA recombinase
MKYFAYCRKSSEGEERQALSIPAQIDEINRVFANDVEIVEWFEEKMSAKAPGRPLYSDMIRRLEKGEADGIIAWHPDRLARNSVDGGWIIHLLDRRTLKDLKFVSYTYEHSPQGLFMLQIMFGQSKYYVDNLSVNVKRGMRKKFEMGWLPGPPPLGYKNDRDTGTIVPDLQRFDLVRRMWTLLLSGSYSIREINKIANEDWGLTTPRSKHRGGRPISLSTTYKMFSNPFYAGMLVGFGECRTGKHQPMITMNEFELARAYLARPSPPRPITNKFAYTGLIVCSCGQTVTAEKKVKPSGRTYIYYHCTRRRRPRCGQPAVTLETIEVAIVAELKRIEIPAPVAKALLNYLKANTQEAAALEAARQASAADALKKTRNELLTLTDLRLRSLIDDGEFLKRRDKLKRRELKLEQGARPQEPGVMLELGECVTLFRNCAVDWFLNGDREDKRMIFGALCSNSVLHEGKLSIQARFPFRKTDRPANCQFGWAVVEDVGTQKREFIENSKKFIRTSEYLRTSARARAAGLPPPPVPDDLGIPQGNPRGVAAWQINRMKKAA